LVWSIGVTVAGYGLGSRIPGIDRYLLPIIAVVVFVSLLPVLLELRRSRTASRT
jgi:membrane-associated protein